MKESPTFDYKEEFELQFLTERELEKVYAKSFINLMSEMMLKYETEIQKAFN